MYAERFVPFVKELAVMVVRCKSMESDDDDIFCYPVVETVQVDILTVVFLSRHYDACLFRIIVYVMW